MPRPTPTFRLATVAGVLLLVPLAARAQSPAPSLPPAIRACLGESDPGRRLDCYDREVARLVTPPERGGTLAGAPVRDEPQRLAPTNPPSAVPAAPVPSAPKAAAHVTARVAKLETGGDQLVLHLDNGEVWEQTVAGASDLSVHPGDAVTVDRQLGSWWLTDRYGATLQVRRVQ